MNRADIELVIKLSEEDYTQICKCTYPNDILVGELVHQVRNGTPLPEGHGRVVDIGPYEGKVIASRKYCGVNKLIEVAELDTIIEADKGE